MLLAKGENVPISECEPQGMLGCSSDNQNSAVRTVQAIENQYILKGCEHKQQGSSNL